MQVFIVDDDLEFASVVKGFIANSAAALATTGAAVQGAPVTTGRDAARAEELGIKLFTNSIEAINATAEEIPDLIFLDVLLDGPDGFTFLNEMQSYEDLAKVPVVLMTSLNLAGKDLGKYGVVGVLNKSEMTPEQINAYVREYGGRKK